MKAIIKNRAGKQYSVKAGDTLDIELLEHSDENKIIFESVSAY